MKKITKLSLKHCPLDRGNACSLRLNLFRGKQNSLYIFLCFTYTNPSCRLHGSDDLYADRAGCLVAQCPLQMENIS
jgi:hypothetical protein